MRCDVVTCNRQHGTEDTPAEPDQRGSAADRYSAAPGCLSEVSKELRQIESIQQPQLALHLQLQQKRLSNMWET